MKSVEFSPAKLNLNLEVLGKRPDGYHNIHSLMIPLDYGDDVFVEVIEGDDGIECVCDHPEVPSGFGNLAWKAADIFLDASKIKCKVKIKIDKRIPVAGGLAGGSSNAAAVLRALNKLLGCPLDTDLLSRLALDVGSDVPFLLRGEPAWVEGRGETVIPFEFPDKWVYLVVNPNFGISTSWVYANLALTTSKLSHNIIHSLIEDIRLLNHLEIPVFKRYPQLREIKREMVASEAKGALMSGSGPSIFGVFEDIEAAENVGRKLTEKEKSSFFTARLASSSLMYERGGGNGNNGGKSISGR